MHDDAAARLARDPHACDIFAKPAPVLEEVALLPRLATIRDDLERPVGHVNDALGGGRACVDDLAVFFSADKSSPSRH
ncbi:hypothetical protein PG993_005664 [Apiospora rasikravindrae]|uniref:Uncharacterized protein n=1 Tax=Apiospora rasikravindrae TaxID=990691 RepID=A0ABR1TG70_9PEZI